MELPLVLRPGDVVKPVGNVQEQLNNVGYYGLTVDNIFGPQTESAVRDFQSRVGLPVTGTVDAATWRRLFSGEPLPASVVGPRAQQMRSLAFSFRQAGYGVEVNLAQKTLYLLQGGAVVTAYPIAIGKPSTPTPTGDFTILNKAFNPGGAFGTRWLGVTEEGIGIHGTSTPSSIGLSVSNGCMRMYNQDVEAIFNLLNVGDPVSILAGDGGSGGGGATYTVQPGDTLYQIAQRYGTTVQALMQANNLTSDILYIGQTLVIPGSAPSPPPPSPPPGPGPAPGPGTTTYVVQAGDTLYLIAQRFNTSLGVLRQLNNLTGDVIYSGQTLIVPAPQTSPTYIVQPGDTLFSIATRYGTTVDALMQLNNLTTTVIYPGQSLRLA